MNYAYDELYLSCAQRMMGDMYDYAVGTLGYTLAAFQKMFLVSRISQQIAAGNPHYLAGKNGCEVAREVVETCTGKVLETEDIMYLDKSPEYWIGWSLAYYQWKRNISFQEIEKGFAIDEMYQLYPTLHEADISLYVETLDAHMQARTQSQLKRLRLYANLSQRELAERSGVPLRQIQLFEQGQRDIRKTQGQTLKQLAQALNCRIETLL